MGRLAALTPPPRRHRIRYPGGRAPHPGHASLADPVPLANPTLNRGRPLRFNRGNPLNDPTQPTNHPKESLTEVVRIPIHREIGVEECVCPSRARRAWIYGFFARTQAPPQICRSITSWRESPDRLNADKGMNEEQRQVSFSIKTVQTQDQLQQVWSFAAPVLALPTGKHTFAFYTDELAKNSGLLVFAERDNLVCGCILGSVENDHVLVGPVAVAPSCSGTASWRSSRTATGRSRTSWRRPTSAWTRASGPSSRQGGALRRSAARGGLIDGAQPVQRDPHPA